MRIYVNLSSSWTVFNVYCRHRYQRLQISPGSQILFLFLTSGFPKSSFSERVYILQLFSCNLSLYYAIRSPVDAVVRHGEREVL